MTGNRFGKLSEMPTKQKIMIVITVIIFVIVLWMIIGMFKGQKTPDITPMPLPAPKTQNNTAMNMNQPGGAPAAPGQSQQTALAQTNVMQISKDTDAMKAQKQAQQDYLDKLNELQLLKVQKEISETNQAIAAARLATVTADKSMTDLLTKPAAPEVSASAYASGLAGPIQSGASIPGVGGKTTAAAPAPVTPKYVVISVSMQLGSWHAVIGESTKLYNVSVGDILPPDGSVVISISTRGVVLQKDDKKQLINIVSSI